MSKTSIEIQSSFPKELQVIETIETPDKIIIKLRSRTHSCECPSCKTTLPHYNSTYLRRVQDLPILGKSVELLIRAYEYRCDNPDCSVKSVNESFDGFVDYCGRMTKRCEDFICTLALETNCESCARICNFMGIKTSGDSVIRMLLRRYSNQLDEICGDSVGIDDFAFKKRQSYGTIVVDEATHRPVALLDGRDGNTLKEWLKNNRHIKTVTRDRAGAYASALSEVLPEAMQIADRFHLHQNLLETIRGVLQGSIPANIKIPEDELHTGVQPDNKKCDKNDQDATNDLNNPESANDCADVIADDTALKKV